MIFSNKKIYILHKFMFNQNEFDNNKNNSLILKDENDK